jgi:hypothetical protein
MNREMLKEAIAEAKTIKETAIASAKAALEEAFTPQLTAMFAERLNEMDEEEGVKENYSSDDQDLSLEEILAELEATNEGDSKMEEEGMYENIDEDLMLEEMSDEDIEELVTSVIDDMIASGKLMAGEESEEEDEMEMDDMEDMDIDMDMEDGEEEIENDEIEIDELLAEILGEEEKVKEGLLDKITSFFGSVLGDFERENKELISKFQKSAKTAEDKKELIDALTAWGRKNQIEGPYIQAARTAASEKYGLGLKGGSTTASMGTFEEAKEMEETINELRNELNEVNLLNAKLLYTNKIFKAKNLTESEKIKVLNTFDKAETVKEVKLVFETLNESFKSTAKKSAIKESLGSASRSITHATPKQPIIEVNDAFARMQRLAGIKK